MKLTKWQFQFHKLYLEEIYLKIPSNPQCMVKKCFVCIDLIWYMYKKKKEKREATPLKWLAIDSVNSL